MIVMGVTTIGKVTVSHTKLESEAGESLMEYSKVEDNKGLPCGFEFRDI